MITIFQNITSTKKPYYITVEKAVERIKKGKSRELVEKIRNTEDKKERQKLKAQLPSYCFSGEFKERKDSALIKHSGLVALDFDHLDDYDAMWKRIISDPYTHIAFRSPSGDGMKVIIKIPPSERTHEKSCVALEKYFNDKKLDAFHDLSRVCYESYDPNIYFNKDSLLFDKLEDVLNDVTFIPEEAITDVDDIYNRILVWLEIKRGEQYFDGNKHKYLLKLAGACSRFGIPQQTAVMYLYHDFSNRTSESVSKADIEKIVRAAYRKFITEFGSAYFTKQGKPIYRKSKKIVSKKDVDVNLYGEDIITLDLVRNDMLYSFENGLNIGESTYFKDIDYHYRMKRGEVTLFHGIPNHGKSTFLIQLLLIKAVKDDYKFAIFSPEQYPPSGFYDEIIHMYIGKNTLPGFSDQMSRDEYEYGMDFVMKHFYYIYPKDEIPTPEYIQHDFEEAISKYNIDGCVIDPYNQLDNDISLKGGREDQYLSSFLTKQKRFALNNKLFVFIVSHPKGSMRKNADGDYDQPTFYDLSGGAMWGNKCDNIILIHRPRYFSEKENTGVLFVSQKIKHQRLCGIPGEVEMEYNRKTMRYYINGKNPLGNLNNNRVVPF